jgi:hypothetical protein
MLGRSSGAENVYNVFTYSSPYPSDDVLTLMSLCSTASYEVQRVETQLTGSDTSSGKKRDKPTTRLENYSKEVL